MSKINVEISTLWNEYRSGRADLPESPSEEFIYLHNKFIETMEVQNNLLMKAEKSMDKWLEINHGLLVKNQALQLDLTRLLKCLQEARKLTSAIEIKRLIRFQLSRLKSVSNKVEDIDEAA